MSYHDLDRHPGTPEELAIKNLQHHIIGLYGNTFYPSSPDGQYIKERTFDELCGGGIIWCHGVQALKGPRGVVPGFNFFPENHISASVFSDSERRVHYPTIIVPRMLLLRLFDSPDFYMPTEEELLNFGGDFLNLIDSIPPRI